MRANARDLRGRHRRARSISSGPSTVQEPALSAAANAGSGVAARHVEGICPAPCRSASGDSDERGNQEVRLEPRGQRAADRARTGEILAGGSVRGRPRDELASGCRVCRRMNALGWERPPLAGSDPCRSSWINAIGVEATSSRAPPRARWVSPSSASRRAVSPIAEHRAKALTAGRRQADHLIDREQRVRGDGRHLLADAGQEGVERPVDASPEGDELGRRMRGRVGGHRHQYRKRGSVPRWISCAGPGPTP